MLTMREKKALTAEIQDRYLKATKKTKGRILDEFCQVIGYTRHGGRKIKYVIGKSKKKRSSGPRIYTHDVFLALRKIWTVFDFICGKRLAPFMAEAIKKLEKHKEIDLTEDVRDKLLMISASTIDRLLKKEKDKFRLGKGRSGTRPGSLLKKQIPVRMFSKVE